MRFPVRPLAILLLLAAPGFADDDRWERHGHHRRFHERIVVVAPPCRHERYDHPWHGERRFDGFLHPGCRTPEPVVVMPAPRHRRAPWLAFGVPVGHGGQVVVKVR